MENQYFSFLCCPGCKTDLILNNYNPANGLLKTVFECSTCKRIYEVTDGIIQFLVQGEVPIFSKRMNLMRKIYSLIYSPATRVMFIPCGGESKARHEVLDRLEISLGSTILETGIGCGDNLPLLKPRFGSGIYFGLDNQKRMLQTCSANIKRWNISAELHLADAEQLPYKDNMFDVVFHLGAFNLFRKKKQALDEMVRVAKPGALILIADETDKASKLYSILLGKQEPVILPLHLVPDEMLEKRLDIIWNTYGYVLTFRKPHKNLS
jgi:ubiquinone/menaquinone biosynthesis C-methylase UbiE/uncharacterized protein YbaR (Trm112 family)